MKKKPSKKLISELKNLISNDLLVIAYKDPQKNNRYHIINATTVFRNGNELQIDSVHDYDLDLTVSESNAMAEAIDDFIKNNENDPSRNRIVKKVKSGLDKLLTKGCI